MAVSIVAMGQDVHAEIAFSNIPHPVLFPETSGHRPKQFPVGSVLDALVRPARSNIRKAACSL